MDIRINLSKDFERTLDDLRRKYGEDFEYINGVHPNQLDYSEFINNFIDEPTLADVSIDPNANASNRDIRSFMTEKGKSSDKLFGLNKIFYTIKKQWGLKTAKEWLEQEFSKGFYLNDSTTASYFPYCFRGDTDIITKDGIHPLKSLVGKDIQVLNKNGEWEKATVKNFGVQKLMLLVLERYAFETEAHIFVTGNHKWFVKNDNDDIEIYKTEDLKEGMKIPYNVEKGSTTNKGNDWFVKSVEWTDLEEEVYCAVAEETHSFTLAGNILTHNCWANDLTRLATEGLFFLKNYNNEAPAHLTTYFDDVIEFVSFLSNRQSGAVGLPNVLIWAWWFWKRDVENDYYMKNPEYYLRQNFQKFIYRLNQPFLRIDQSAFTNVSIFDRPYLEGIFGGIEFPDGTLLIDNIEELIDCQKLFMEVAAEIRRTENMFTYPVFTYSLLKRDDFKDGEVEEMIRTKKWDVFVDVDFARWCSDHNIEWSDSNFFCSDNVGILSNCCFDGSQMTLTKSNNEVLYKSFKELYESSNDYKEDFSIYHNGNWKKGRVIRLPKRKLYKITTANNKEIIVTDNHINPTLRGDVETKYLSTDDYLLFNNSKLDSVKEVDMNLSYEQGVSLGKYLNTGEKIEDSNLIDKFIDNGLISLDCLEQSYDFRRGIIDTYSDEHNVLVLRSVSKSFINRIEIIINSLGLNSMIEPFNGVYSIGWNNENSNTKDVSIVKDDSIYFKIDSIEPYQTDDNYVYCFEMEDEPYFTLPNGIITHNCRLLSDTKKLDAFINSIGGTALSVGSCRVSTINLVRIAYESNLDKDEYIRILKERVELDCKALYSMRHILKRNIEKGLLPNYQEGAVELDKQFCTIGGIGVYEVMDMFGLIDTDEFGCKSYSDEAIEFTTKILDTMNYVKDNFKCDFTFNIEMIPAENCAGVICKADNLIYNQNKYFIYSNQWIPLMEKCTLKEKCRLGSLFDEKCGGGCIAHINSENRFPTSEAAWDMLNYVAASGVIYFAFTTKIKVCKHKHAFISEKKCPVCGEDVADTYARVVGFYVPVSSYQQIRKQEFDNRKWMNLALNDGIMQ